MTAAVQHPATCTSPDEHREHMLETPEGPICTACGAPAEALAQTVSANGDRSSTARSAPAPGAAEGDPTREAPIIVTAEQFAAVDEPGADPLLGEAGEAVIPEGGDVMLYGDGGASKTTLSIDLACHLAAGDPWLGLPVSRPVRVLLVEAEGPKPLFRQKIDAKLAAWSGSNLGGRLLIWERPWAEFRFTAEQGGAAELAETEIDVLIAGPLTAVGMDELGTLQQVREFMAQVGGFRALTGRRLTVFLVHHENKGGSVSGAWEGAGDTLLHAQVHGPGRTTLTFQKARWASRWHKQALELDWADGEGFEVAEESTRDLEAEIRAWLLEQPHSTPAEIATRKKVKAEDGTERAIDGIGASEVAVKDALNANPALFRVRTGEDAKAVGRHSTARVWEVVADAS